MKYKLLFITLLVCGMGLGQVVVSWDFTSDNNPNINLPGGSTNLTFNTGGTNGVSGCTGNGFSTSGWNVGEYLQIAFSSLNYNITTVAFNVRSSGTGPRNFKVQYSATGVNGVFSDLNSTFVSGNGVCLSGTADFSSISSISNNTNSVFRFVFTGGEADGSPATGDASPTGTFRIDDLVINGNLIQVNPTSTTFTTSWSNGTGPTTSLDAVIAGNLTTSSDLACKDLTINSGTTLTIGAGKKLTVAGNLINNGSIVFKSDVNGTAMFDVFNGAQSGTGVVTVERLSHQTNVPSDY